MPWNAKQFASSHNKKLTGPAASKAAEQASAMVRSGVPEGIAIATANKTGDRMQARGRQFGMADMGRHFAPAPKVQPRPKGKKR